LFLLDEPIPNKYLFWQVKETQGEIDSERKKYPSYKGWVDQISMFDIELTITGEFEDGSLIYQTFEDRIRFGRIDWYHPNEPDVLHTDTSITIGKENLVRRGYIWYSPQETQANKDKLS
jgi:hypothetical protein